MKAPSTTQMPIWFPILLTIAILLLLLAIFIYIMYLKSWYITFPFACLSIIGCLSVLFAVYKFPKLRHRTNYFIVCLTLMDAIVCLAFLMTVNPNILPSATLCSIQAFMINFSLLSQCFFCASLMAHLLYSFRYPEKKDRAIKILIYSNIVIFVAAAVLSSLPMYLNGQNLYKYLGAHCWISNKTVAGSREQLICLYFWIWLNIVIIFLQVGMIRYHYRTLIAKLEGFEMRTVRNPILAQANTESKRGMSLWGSLSFSPTDQMPPVMIKLLKTIRIISLYPIVEGLTWIPITTYRSIQVFFPNYHSLDFEVIGNSSVLLAGFLNSCIFFTNTKNFHSVVPYFEWLYEQIPDCCKNRNKNEDVILRDSGATADFSLEDQSTTNLAFHHKYLPQGVKSINETFDLPNHLMNEGGSISLQTLQPGNRIFRPSKE